MKTIRIIDKETIKNSNRYKNQAGFLVLPECTLAKSGILEYSEVSGEDGKMIAGGELIPVYRPASALKNCYKMFSNLPLTKQHPDNNEVNPNNAKDVVVGSLGQNPRYEERDGEGYVICDIIVYDAETIKAIEDGTLEELSAGYETAFRKKRGVTPNGNGAYEAEQFYLSPNHVALVERGRCGSECRICDRAENNKKKELNMARRKKNVADSKGFRYLLSIGDGEEAVEITAEQAEKLQEENPEVEVEEISEDELEETEVKIPGQEELEVEDEDEEELEVEDEDEEEVKVEEEMKKDEDELVFEVQFEDGTTGKMDENTYNYIQRFLEVNKTGDAAETVASLAVLSSKATKILGDEFDMANYVKGKKVDAAAIKKDCIKKVLPQLVLRELKGDALDRVFKTAVDSASRMKSEWSKDILGIAKAADKTVCDAASKSPVLSAREAYLKRINGKGE